MKITLVFISIGFILIGVKLTIIAMLIKDNLAYNECKQELIERNAPNSIKCIRGETYIQVKVDNVK